MSWVRVPSATPTNFGLPQLLTGGWWARTHLGFAEQALLATDAAGGPKRSEGRATGEAIPLRAIPSATPTNFGLPQLLTGGWWARTHLGFAEQALLATDAAGGPKRSEGRATGEAIPLRAIPSATPPGSNFPRWARPVAGKNSRRPGRVACEATRAQRILIGRWAETYLLSESPILKA